MADPFFLADPFFDPFFERNSGQVTRIYTERFQTLESGCLNARIDPVLDLYKLTNMASLFDIDKSFIKAVDDEIARELVARLCRAELRAQGLPESAVIWGGNQRAADGGVDVRVDCSKALSSPDFIPSAQTVIQVKAEIFGPSKISKEMAPKGILRATIAELGKIGGAYLIVSTKDDVSDRTLKPRREKIRSCLAEHGIGDSVKSDFYDSRRIADWVEQHPPVAAWLRQKINQPLKGWQAYGPWAYKEQDVSAEYLIDDEVRVFTPNEKEEVSASQAIGQLRSDLSRPGSVRLVGLSGVGKTRLVQALFDARVCSESAALSPDNVIYTDLSDEPDPVPSAMLEKLLDQNSDAVVVVDNCGSGTHAKLTELVKKRAGSQLKLITIEYDIRDELPEDTRCYRLEGVSQEVLKKLLERRYSSLSYSDADRIADFSDGNARVAFALASTAASGGELSKLGDGELFDRLFSQKKETSEELRTCAEAASLLYSFDWDDASPNGELALLAGFADVSPRTFRKNMAELSSRGLLQARGKWRAVLPHAIANGLAKRIVESETGDDLYNVLIHNATERVARSFCRRLGYLHDCPGAVAVASRMFAVDGKFGDVTTLTDYEQQMFENLAPVDPEGALGAIERATQSDGFLQKISFFKDRFARITRLIAYDPEYFEWTVSILQKVASATPVAGNRNLIRDMLVSLFYCHLSGTKASPAQRQKIVKELLWAENEPEQDLGFDLLTAGLQTSHFTTMHSCEFGAHRRDYGWCPRTIADMKDWYVPWVEMTVSLGENAEAVGSRARIVLAHAFRGLWPWEHAGIFDILIDAAKRFHATDGWVEGWLAVRETLRYDAKKLPPSSIEKLKKLEKMLAPSGLVERIRACVLARGHFAYDFADEDILDTESGKELSVSEMALRARMNAERLGELAAIDIDLLMPLLPELCSGNGGNRYQFGLGVGKHCADVIVLIDGAREVIKNLERSNVDPIWLRGLINGWNSADSDAVSVFLDQALENDVWQKWFVELQLQAGVSERGFERLMRALDPGVCPTWQFSYLGHNLDLLTVSQIKTLAHKLTLRTDGGLARSVDMLGCVVHSVKEKSATYKEELGQALRDFLAQVDWLKLNDDGRGMTSYYLEKLVEVAVQTARAETDLKLVLERIHDVDDEEYISYDDVRRDALTPIFKRFPRYALSMVFVPGDDGKFRKSRIATTDPLFDRSKGNPFDQIPKEVLVEWCDEEPESRYPFAAKVCQLFNTTGPNDELSDSITKVAVELVNMAPNPAVIIEIFVGRFFPRSWSGSRANLLESRLPLFDQLIIEDNENLRSLIEAKKVAFEKEIAGEREFESSRERKRDSSFE